MKEPPSSPGAVLPLADSRSILHQEPRPRCRSLSRGLLLPPQPQHAGCGCSAALPHPAVSRTPTARPPGLGITTGAGAPSPATPFPGDPSRPPYAELLPPEPRAGLPVPVGWGSPEPGAQELPRYPGNRCSATGGLSADRALLSRAQPWPTCLPATGRRAEQKNAATAQFLNAATPLRAAAAERAGSRRALQRPSSMSSTHKHGGGGVVGTACLKPTGACQTKAVWGGIRCLLTL